LKALVEIGSREDKGFFLNAWRSSNDEENCLWAFAGLIKVSTLDEFEKLKKESQFPVSDHVLLAACIAGKPNFVQGLSPVKIDNAGRIVLLWACLCFAIDRKRENIFDPKFDQIIQLAELNLHDDFVVSQYSIYSMGRLAGIDFNDTKFNIHDLRDKEESVRKWGYHLILKNAKGLSENMDFWREVVDIETSEVAIEGFASGLKNHHVDGVTELVIQLLSSKNADRIELTLLDHVCKFSDIESYYAELIEENFKKRQEDKTYRSRCLEASKGKSLYGNLKRIEYEESRQYVFGEEYAMVKSTINIGTLHTSNVAIGDGNIMSYNSIEFQKLYDELEKELKAISKSKTSIDGDISRQITSDVENLKAVPNKAAGIGLLDKLEKVAKGSEAGAKIVAGAATILEKIVTLLPS
jgi:hypothetical protein